LDLITRFEREYPDDAPGESIPRTPEEQAVIDKLIIERQHLLEWLTINEVSLHAHYATLTKNQASKPRQSNAAGTSTPHGYRHDRSSRVPQEVHVLSHARRPYLGK
jgi:hypothetical protein